METVATVVAGHLAADDGSEFLRLILPGSGDAVLSYAELVREATGWTALYRDRGLQPGDRVIVTLRHSVDLYAAYLGALLGGFVPAMFAFPSPKLSEDEYFRTLGSLLRSAGARLFVTYDELAAALHRRAGDALGDTEVVTGPASEAIAVTDWISVPNADAEATAFLQYSSGTTGLKKGVAVSHGALLWHAREYGRAIGVDEHDRIVSWLPLYHDMGLIACFFLPVLLKVPVVAMSPFDWVARPRMWLEAATEHGATLAWLPNFAYALLAAAVTDDDLDGLDLASLRGVVNCSEPLMASSQDAFSQRFGAVGWAPERFAASYAMAENTFAVTSGGFPGPPVTDWIDGATFDAEHRAEPAAPGSAGARPLVSSGRALPETDVLVVDAERRPLGERELGELAVRSPGLMSGYDANPDETAASMGDGFFYTGDLGYIADGEVYVTGRRKDLVIIGGRNIYPQDVEDAVLAVEGVVPGRAVAFGVADARQGTEHLVVIAESEQPETAWADLRRSIRRALVERADVIPRVVEIVAPRTLVKSSSGKLARGENRARYVERQSQAGSPPRATAPGPGSDVHAAVRACVLDVVQALGADPVDIEDATPLVSTGLIDSFGLGELLSAVEDACGVRIGSDALAGAPLDSIDDVVALVEAVSAGGAAASPAAEELDRGAIPMAYSETPAARRSRSLRSLFYRALLRTKGIRVGSGLQVLGPLMLQIEGHGRNVRIGRNVTLMPGVHLKVRENGTIVLHDGVKLDTGVRLVAANDATIELGQHVALGLGTVVNAGRDVRVGRGTMSAAHCVINASDHGLAREAHIREQPYEHAPIHIGEDVWLGASVVVAKGAQIGHGAVISAGEVVSGSVPGHAVVGRSGRVIKYRR